MLKNKTIKLFSAFIFSLTSFNNAYAQDFCKNLEGYWQGTTRVVKNFHVCNYEISFETTKKDSTFIFLGGLSNGRPTSFGRCVNQTFMLVGTCQNNQLTFSEGGQGEISGNFMKLQKHTAPFVLGDATLTKVN